MKHIKLFEQFEDDPFGEEVYPDELRIIRYGGNYYILESIDKVFNKDYVTIYSNKKTLVKSNMVVYEPSNMLKGDDIIHLFNYRHGGTSEIKFKNLPQEIKDRLR